MESEVPFHPAHVELAEPDEIYNPFLDVHLNLFILQTVLMLEHP